jgi:hypothetical protein
LLIERVIKKTRVVKDISKNKRTIYLRDGFTQDTKQKRANEKKRMI